MRSLLIVLLVLTLASAAVAQTPPGEDGVRYAASNVGATPAVSNVNIRSGPGLEYRTIGRLAFGKSLEVVGYNGYDLSRSCDEPFLATLDMWIMVQLPTRRGWVARCAVVVTGSMRGLLVQPAP